jgi:hypothetical protein
VPSQTGGSRSGCRGREMTAVAPCRRKITFTRMHHCKGVPSLPPPSHPPTMTRPLKRDKNLLYQHSRPQRSRLRQRQLKRQSIDRHASGSEPSRCQTRFALRRPTFQGTVLGEAVQSPVGASVIVHLPPEEVLPGPKKDLTLTSLRPYHSRPAPYVIRRQLARHRCAPEFMTAR